MNARIILFLTLLTTAYGCQKVIHIDLNSSAPRYVIEGNVTDAMGPYTVSITRSVNFDENNIFPGVAGLLVTISDLSTGFTDTLQQTASGIYKTQKLQGMTGHTYRMYVKDGGNIFTASSTMPMHVPIDSLYTQKSSFGKELRLVPAYHDPAGVKNYYHFRQYQNDSETKAVFLRTDLVTDGQKATQALGGTSINPGDSMTVYLQCIDSAVYQYYYSLRQTMDQNSGTPANPITNITGGALGYFSAHASDMKHLIVH